MALRDALLTALDGPYWTGAATRLRAEVLREQRSAATIRRLDPLLAAEIPAFLDRLTAQAGTAGVAAALLVAQRPHLEARAAGREIIGRARPPSASEVARLLESLVARHAGDLADPHFVHGDRATPMLSDPETGGGVYVAENRVDQLVAGAVAIAAAWLETAPRATSGVTVTVDGRPVAPGRDGTFVAPVGAGGHRVVARDGAGGATGVRITA